MKISQQLSVNNTVFNKALIHSMSYKTTVFIIRNLKKKMRVNNVQHIPISTFVKTDNSEEGSLYVQDRLIFR